MEPNGVMEEGAGGLIRLGRSGGGGGARAPFDQDALIRRSIDVYTSYGTTTIQDGGSSAGFVQTLRVAAEREPLKADIAVYARLRSVEDVESIPYEKTYTGGARVAGIKFGLDGSPQGRTAWVTEPYVEGPPGAAPDYVAYGTMDPDRYKAGAATLIKAKSPASRSRTFK